MPAATDNVLLVEQKLWTLLLAWPPLTTTGSPSLVAPANFIRYDVAANPMPKVNQPLKRDGDIPFLSIVPTSYAMDPRAVRTFCSIQNLRTQKFAHTIVGGNLLITTIGQIRAEIEAAYFTAGPQLGMPASVAKWDFSGRYEVASLKVAGTANRRSITFDLNVTIKG